MLKNTPKSNSYKNSKSKSKSKKKLSLTPAFFSDRRLHLTLGFILLAISFVLLVSFISYIFTGKADQSVVAAYLQDSLSEIRKETRNWFGLLGAITSHYFIFKWFGVASFLIPPLLLAYGYEIIFKKPLISLSRLTIFTIFFLFWVSLLLGYILIDRESVSEWGFLAGGIGFELALTSDSLMGWGTFVFLLLTLLIFIVYYFNVTSILIPSLAQNKPKESIDAQEEILGESSVVDLNDEEATEEESSPGEVEFNSNNPNKEKNEDLTS
jgi:S-DNA-T family DNA segregation ATPase FtsK/SpoIIIE